MKKLEKVKSNHNIVYISAQNKDFSYAGQLIITLLIRAVKVPFIVITR